MSAVECEPVHARTAPAQFVDTNTLLSQIPADVPPGVTSVTSNYHGSNAAAFPITIDTFAPTIVPPAGTILSSFTDIAGNYISAANPAAPLTSVSCTAIGLGPTNPLMITNVPPPVPANTTNFVQVFIGTTQVTPDFAGLVTGSAPGYYRVTFRVPADTPLGNQTVTIAVGGRTSNAATLTVGLPKSARLVLTSNWQPLSANARIKLPNGSCVIASA